jgi:hypothetical protein
VRRVPPRLGEHTDEVVAELDRGHRQNAEEQR